MDEVDCGKEGKRGMNSMGSGLNKSSDVEEKGCYHRGNEERDAAWRKGSSKDDVIGCMKIKESCRMKNEKEKKERMRLGVRGFYLFFWLSTFSSAALIPGKRKG